MHINYLSKQAIIETNDCLKWHNDKSQASTSCSSLGPGQEIGSAPLHRIRSLHLSDLWYLKLEIGVFICMSHNQKSPCQFCPNLTLIFQHPGYVIVRGDQ